MSGEAVVAGWRRKLRLGVLVAAGLLLALSPWVAPLLFSHLSFFRMRKVEVHGLRYLPEADLLARLAVDTTMSVWTDLRALEERLEGHPQLRGVKLSRRLPGTLVVRVDERRPLALLPRSQGFVAVDDSGAALPVDPSTGTMDVPIIRSSDTSVVRLLGELRKDEPGLYQRISEISRVGRDELRIELASYSILAMSDVTVQRLLDILPVERDLRAKGVRVSELDLRFQGQVIARMK